MKKIQKKFPRSWGGCWGRGGGRDIVFIWGINASPYTIPYHVYNIYIVVLFLFNVTVPDLDPEPAVIYQIAENSVVWGQWAPIK